MRFDAPLSEWSERYIASRPEPLSYYGLWFHRAAVKWFQRWLGRVATVDDVSEESLAAAVCASSLSAHTLDIYLCKLFAVWRFAHRQGAGSRPSAERLRTEPSRVWKNRKRKAALVWCKRAATMKLVAKATGKATARRPEPEIILPKFDGAAVSAEAAEVVEVKREKYSRYRKRW
jgi:hypothetical protein